jgi:hypothetical protein
MSLVAAIPSHTTQNPLFPVNLADLLLRHSSANHKRETLAFSKRRQGTLYRMAIWWFGETTSRTDRRIEVTAHRGRRWGNN